jgi:dTDP-4-dehydrorhamnose reductase
MIWLIGNRGMLGSDMELLLKSNSFNYISSDVEVDITDDSALEDFAASKRIDWIINCSAYTAVDRAEDEPDKAYNINADGVLNIARAAKRTESTLVHISTDYVFNGRKRGLYSEMDKPDPLSVYGKSKLMGEEYIKNTLKKYFILRTSWLFGPQGNNFVSTMLRLMEEKDIIRVVSDQFGSPTYTKDLAQAVMSIVTSNVAHYGIYHYTNDGKTNWYDFAREIYKGARKYGITDKEIEFVSIGTKDYPTPARRPKNTQLSKEKIKKVFGVEIRSWQDALHDYFNDARGPDTQL